MKLLNQSLSERLKIESDLGLKYQSFMGITERTLYNWRKANEQGKKTKLTSPPSIQYFVGLGLNVEDIFQ